MRLPGLRGIFRLAEAFGILAFALLLGWGLLGYAPRPPLLDDVPFGSVALDAKGGILKIGLAADDKYRLKANLDEIPPKAVEALLHYEDKYFYLHPGVNPLALMRAAWASLLGSRKLGASTLTMQVARLRYGLKTTTAAGKLWQIFQALLLERHYQKHEILEAYFNLAPYGGNIEGIEGAARIYFGKAARELTDQECIALTVIPQNPAARGPVGGREFDMARARLAASLGKGEAPRLALRGKPPFLAPHLAMEVLDEQALPTGRAHTYIERDLQRLLEDAIANLVEHAAGIGVRNAAAMLVNADNMRVCALAGSAGFGNAAIQGQVDGTRARRSPGSTLKPFIYALALEQGLIHPASILNDSPKSFGGYDPENFDKGFRGPLSAADALVASRNLPALILSEKLAAPGLYGFLKDGGVKLPRDAAHYGLALALGGAEISMRELAALYAMLANQGIWRPLRLVKSAAPQAWPRRLLSPESSHIVLRMLERPDLFAGPVPLRCKTGTSNGFRDAWSVGLCGQYVLAVWVGNFDNRSNPAFVGGELALPLFREIAAGLAMRRTLRDDLPPREASLNLQKVEVCKSTGDIAKGQCADTTRTLFIPGISPTRDSGIIRPLLIDKKTGLRACERIPGRTEDLWWEFWPSEQRKIFAQAGFDKPLPPDWLPECRKRMAGKNSGPTILLPKKNVTYFNDFSANSQNIPLKASLDAEASFVHWFAGKSYIGKSGPNEVIFWQPATPGNFEIVAVDNLGQTSRQKCEVGRGGKIPRHVPPLP